MECIFPLAVRLRFSTLLTGSNGNNVATAKVKLKLNGQFMDSSFNEESLKSVSASINADTPPLFYPGL